MHSLNTIVRMNSPEYQANKKSCLEATMDSKNRHQAECPECNYPKAVKYISVDKMQGIACGKCGIFYDYDFEADKYIEADYSSVVFQRDVGLPIKVCIIYSTMLFVDLMSTLQEIALGRGVRLRLSKEFSPGWRLND